MKRSVLFKSLVDILYFLLIVGFLGSIFTIALSKFDIYDINFKTENFGFFYWSILIINLITYLIFLRGLFFLRKVARILLSGKYFNQNIIVNLKKSGVHFLLTGIISSLVLLLSWLSKINLGKMEFVFDSNLISTLFLAIIGLFFIIQSHTLYLANEFKEENDLTV